MKFQKPNLLLKRQLSFLKDAQELLGIDTSKRIQEIENKLNNSLFRAKNRHVKPVEVATPIEPVLEENVPEEIRRG